MFTIVIATKWNPTVQTVTYSYNKMLVINMKKQTIDTQITWMNLKNMLSERSQA